MIELPLSFLCAIGTGLTGAIAYVFRMLIMSHERRSADLLKQCQDANASSKTERDRADEDRGRYVSSMELLVGSVRAESDSLAKQMIGTLAANTEAIRVNTTAREVSNLQMEKIMREVVSVVILKLVELGFLQAPQRPPFLPEKSQA